MLERTPERFRIDNTTMIRATVGVKPLLKEHGPKIPDEKEEITNIPYREAKGAFM